MNTHTCSYYCDRFECIRAQRDELRQKLEQAEKTVPSDYSNSRQQEPVAWIVDGKSIKIRLDMAGKLYYSESNVYGKDVVDEAIEQEREACAKLAEQGLIGHTIAQAIRARGEK